MEENKTYSPVSDYLIDDLGINMSEFEIQNIIKLSINQYEYDANKGYCFERTKYNPRGLAFFECWLKENEPKSWVNYGHGILQDLFIERTETLGGNNGCKMMVEITNRDRRIVATVIQWLGSNVGMAFLSEALSKFGATIQYK